MKISIEKRITLGFLLIVSTVVFFSTITYRINADTSSSNFWVNHTNQVLYKSEKIVSILKDIESANRGFIITGDNIFFEPYHQNRDSIFKNIQQLKELTKDNPIQQLRIDSLYSLAIIKLALSDTLAGTAFKDRNTLLFYTLRGKLLMNKLRDVVTAIQLEEDRLLLQRETINNKNEGKLKTIFYIFSGSIFLVFVIAYLIMRYNFSVIKKDGKALFQLNSRLKFFRNQADDIIEGISDPFFALDFNGKFIYLNTAAQKKLTYDKGSLIGKNIFEVFTRYNDTTTGKNIRLVQQTQKPLSFEVYDDFFEYWQDITIYPTREGLTVYIKDASNRKAGETELLKTKQFLEEINAVAIIGGWEVDLIKGIVNWTSVTGLIHETDTGYLPDLERGFNFYKEGESRDTIIKLVTQAMEQGTGWDVELQIITAKGNERWVRTKGKTEFDEHNKCIRLFGTFQDIDGQKKLDYKLLQSEKQFRSAFEYSAIGMALVNTDGKWKEVNESLCNIVGYSHSELSKLTFHNITHPEDLQIDLNLLQELIDGKRQSYQLEKRYLHKDGHIVWVLLAVSMVKNQQGEIVHFISQIQDISEKKLTEKALADERKLLRTIIDHIPLNVYLKDMDSKKILVNKNEIEYMGAAGETEILGKSDIDLFPYANAIISIEEDKQVIKTGFAIIDKETISQRNDGTETFFLTSKIPFLNDKDEITGVLGISYDITARNKIKKLLEASEQKLSTLFDLSPVGFALSEFKSGIFLEFNIAFAGRLGYNSEELKKLNRLKIISEKYWETEKAIMQSINKTITFGPVEMEHVRKNGTSYPILISGVKVMDINERELIWTVVQDITNLKEKEEELKKLNLSVAETNRELAIKNEELEQFAYVASHDLQEPLRMITGFISKIEKKYYDILDDDGKKYISFAVDGAKRMRLLIADILNYARLDNNDESNITSIDLNILIQEIIQSVKNSEGGHNAIIKSGTLPVINAHSTAIQQLFLNLITNAIKYQQPGNTPVITIKAEDSINYWKFSITDNGIGIDPKYFHKVFNIFQRLHNKEQYSGTGIGLAICKKIVTKLKGEIWIESQKGFGSAFFFTLLK